MPTQTLEQLFLKEGVLVIAEITSDNPRGVYLQKLFTNKSLLTRTVGAMATRNLQEGGIFKEITGIVGLGAIGIPVGMQIAESIVKNFIPFEMDSSTEKIGGFAGEQPLLGQKVAIVTDIVEHGNVCENAIDLLRKAGAECMGIATIFDYELKYRKEFTVPFNSLITPRSIIREIAKQAVV